MPVESIVSAPGRVLLRTQGRQAFHCSSLARLCMRALVPRRLQLPCRHYLLRGVWSRDFPLVIHGTGIC